MSHDEFLPEPMDPDRIELGEHHELLYWMRELGCSAEQLLDAIEAVGIQPGAVVSHLAIRRQSSIVKVTVPGATRAGCDGLGEKAA